MCLIATVFFKSVFQHRNVKSQLKQPFSSAKVVDDDNKWSFSENNNEYINPRNELFMQQIEKNVLNGVSPELNSNEKFFKI